MIKLENVRICPFYNENFIIADKENLFDITKGTPIIYKYNYEKYEQRFAESKIIGFVDFDYTIKLKDNFLVGNIYIDEEFSDYTFKNYECSVNYISKKENLVNIKNIYVIEFDKEL